MARRAQEVRRAGGQVGYRQVAGVRGHFRLHWSRGVGGEGGFHTQVARLIRGAVLRQAELPPELVAPERRGYQDFTRLLGAPPRRG